MSPLVFGPPARIEPIRPKSRWDPVAEAVVAHPGEWVGGRKPGDTRRSLGSSKAILTRKIMALLAEHPDPAVAKADIELAIGRDPEDQLRLFARIKPLDSSPDEIS